jgi:hypothetical protein
MRRLKLKELLTLTETTDQGLRTLRRRGHIALAFGQRDAYDSLSYLEIDGVGWLLAGTLAKPYGQTEASQLIRIHGDIWAEVVAEAEADPMIDQNFCIVDFERESDGKRAHMACGSSGATPEAIAATLQRSPEAQGYVAVRVNCVNVSHLIRFLRKSGARHGIDLTRPFLPRRDHRAFAEIFAPYVETRDAAIVHVRDRRSREAFARKAGEQARAVLETIQ